MEILPDGCPPLPDDVITSVTIGVFDGVHLGHRAVIEQTRRRAEALGARSAVVTFDQHPALVLRPENAPKLLTSLEQRLELLDATGVDYVYLIEFDEQRARTTPDEFILDVFVDTLHARAVTVGQDFHFGRDRAGNLVVIETLGLEHGFDVLALELVRKTSDAAEPISSTAIRRHLAGGNVSRAMAKLGRPYSIRGVVIHGDGRGRTIGFPTANIPVDPAMAWPADGVYAGWATRHNGGRHGCAINIGHRPTFHEHAERSVLEAHLLDFDESLYGETMEIEFVEFLRSEQRFSGVDSLVEQLKVDIDEARSILAI